MDRRGLRRGSLLAPGAHAIVVRVERDDDVVPAGEEETITDEAALTIDPTPLTIDGFVLAPALSHPDAASGALAHRGPGVIVRRSPGASEAMIAAAEARLGVTLPEPLRALYRVMNGGFVDYVYVPRRPHPRPLHDDWRGVFSSSSLLTLDQLRTVADHYADFTDDPEDIPADADRRIVLQAQYGDMTLLDYAHGDVPRVLIVDYDREGDDPVDMTFADFAEFFAALRRVVPDGNDLSRSEPLDGLPPGEQATAVWADGKPHRLFNAAAPADRPERRADDALVDDTEARLGLTLPPALMAWWRVKNGGEIAWRYLDASGAPVGGFDIWQHPVPLEYMVSLRTLSDRIAFPPDEAPWADLFREPERLIVLHAEEDRAVMLDYRGGDDAPGVLVARRLGDGDAGALAVASIPDFFARLRRYHWRG